MRLDEHHQSKVEAASAALVLHVRLACADRSPSSGETATEDSTPLAAAPIVPWLETGGRPERDRWYFCAVGIGDAAFGARAPSPSEFAEPDDGAATMRIRRGDGNEDEVTLPAPWSAPRRSSGA